MGLTAGDPPILNQCPWCGEIYERVHHNCTYNFGNGFTYAIHINHPLETKMDTIINLLMQILEKLR